MQRYRRLFIMVLCVMGILVMNLTHLPRLTAQVPSVPVAVTLPKAKVTDRVPVIVTLKNTDGLERPLDSVTIKTERRTRVKRTQDAFLARQKATVKAVKRQMTVMPVVVVEVTRSDIATLRQDSAVASVVVDEPVKPTMYESIILTGASAAHAIGATGAGTSVAVLDTGVAKNHPFLRGQVVSEACF